MRQTRYLFILFCISLLLPQCSSLKQDQPSFKSRMIYNSLGSMDFSKKTFDQLLADPKRGTNEISPEKINKKLQVEQRTIEGFQVVTVSSAEACHKHILFFHGGAYFAEAAKAHRFLIEKLALKYAFRVSFVDYPLAPENTAATTLRIATEAYREIAKAHPQDTLFLFGDSAGGGLALALLQALQNNQDTRMPLKTALVSPWVDASMSNTEIEYYTDKDVILNREGLLACAEVYAGELDLKDPIISPLHGKLENLSEIGIWVSSYELFYPDCVVLYKELNSSTGSNALLTVKEQMMHDWIALPIRERDETLAEIADFLNKP